MNPETNLLDNCKEWRRLAEAESEAVRARNWGLAASCQKAMQQLQPRMLDQFHAARQKRTSSEIDRARLEKKFRAAVGELIEMERRNSACLASVPSAAKTQLASVVFRAFPADSRIRCEGTGSSSVADLLSGIFTS